MWIFSKTEDIEDNHWKTDHEIAVKNPFSGRDSLSQRLHRNCLKYL